MSSFRNLDVQLAQCEGLQQAIQVELANRDYSSEDDPVMAEYIVVMLANQKTAQQITAEMKELIGDEYDADFTQWIWKATRSFLEQHGAATDAAEGSTSAAAAAADAAARTRNARLRRSRSPQVSGSAPRTRDNRRSRSPAQPDARRGNEQRRSRSRSPPAPASQRREYRMARDYSSNEAWKSTSAPRRDDQPPFDGAAYWRNKAEERRRNPPPRVGAPPGERAFQNAYDQAVRNSLADVSNGNAGRELFPAADRNGDPELPTYEQTGGISIFGRAGVPDPRAAEFVPSFAAAQPPAEPSTVAPEAATNGESSIFSRIDPMLPDNQPLPTAAPEATHSSDFPTAPTETSICRWNLGCTNPMCPYSHASPSAAGPNGDPNALVLSQQNCRYGSGCTNKDCTRSHVSPAVARLRPRPAPPAFFTQSAPAPSAPVVPQTLSMETALPSQTSSRPCRFGASCTRADCFFSHPPSRSAPSSGAASSTPCRFGLGCTRADCYFAHPPGQRATAQTGTVNRLAVFAQPDEHMETILPGAQRDGSETVSSTPGITT